MKVRFSMQEKLYADVEFEIECENPEQVEEALDQIGRKPSSGCCGSAWRMRLKNSVGVRSASPTGPKPPALSPSFLRRDESSTARISHSGNEYGRHQD